MKILSVISVLAVVFCGTLNSYGQAIEAEVPGDHFSLEGALELFKQSESPEEFERLLNSADSKVNNLDLNGDGYIDYIRVHDRYEGNVHAFIIQAVVSEREVQDVAVITLEKLANGKAVLQIIGDEDIYGVETIIEPTQEVRTYAGATTTRAVVNVWAWPSVQYVYGPYYTGWVSPWGWYDRPIWWRPWRPVAYVYYHPIWRPYYSYYSLCPTRRIAYAHHIYHPYRSTSVIVHHRHHDQVSRYRSHYHDRDRYEGRRSYVSDDRSGRVGGHPQRGSDSYRNERTGSGDIETPSSGRTSSRQRGATLDNQRTDIETNRQDSRSASESRRAGMTSGVESERRPVQSNRDVNRERTSPSRVVREQSTTNERAMRTEIQRNPTEMRRSNVPATRPSGSYEGNRHAPATRPSGSFDNNRRSQVQQPARSSSVDRRSSSPSPSVGRSSQGSRTQAVPPRSSSRSGNAGSENKRGRQ